MRTFLAMALGGVLMLPLHVSGGMMEYLESDPNAVTYAAIPQALQDLVVQNQTVIKADADANPVQSMNVISMMFNLFYVQGAVAQKPSWTEDECAVFADWNQRDDNQKVAQLGYQLALWRGANRLVSIEEGELAHPFASEELPTMRQIGLRNFFYFKALYALIDEHPHPLLQN